MEHNEADARFKFFIVERGGGADTEAIYKIDLILKTMLQSNVINSSVI
jgi:hypothetical protein